MGECELLKWLFNKSDWQEQKRVKHLGVFFLHLESQDCKLPDSFKRDFQPSWHTKRGGVWIEVWVSVCCNWFSGNEPAAWEKCQWAHWATGKWSTLNSWGLPNDVFPYFWQLFPPNTCLMLLLFLSSGLHQLCWCTCCPLSFVAEKCATPLGRSLWESSRVSTVPPPLLTPRQTGLPSSH